MIQTRYLEGKLLNKRRVWGRMKYSPVEMGSRDAPPDYFCKFNPAICVRILCFLIYLTFGCKSINYYMN